MLIRAIIVGLFALIAVIQIVRTAVVAAFAEDRLHLVADLWPSHPDVLRSMIMTEVGLAAGSGQGPSPATLERVEQLAAAAPLYAEPFLVGGALAQRTGHFARAERLLVQARQREPRSAAARYLLGDLYLRSGRVVPGLAEMSVLARLMPGGAAVLVPAVAEFARARGSVAKVRAILNAYPELEPAVLSELAKDPRNAGLILTLARSGTASDETRAWLTTLLANLIEEGEYGKAYSIWARLNGVERGSARGLFNPTFRSSNHPPPFNWALSSAGGGVAEPEGDGLHVLYFGRDDVALARQLLLLPSGRYRLAANVVGELGTGSAVSWALTCLPDKRQVLNLPLARRSGANFVAGEFQVPAQGCDAQWLELKGNGQEFPKPADFRISGVQLTRLRG